MQKIFLFNNEIYEKNKYKKTIKFMIQRNNEIILVSSINVHVISNHLLLERMLYLYICHFVHM